MPNKIDITQTNAQLYNYITVWSGSNFTGPVRSVPIYNSSGTSSVAQAISDEYYLVRRGGEIIWAPIVSGGGSTLMFSLSPLTEESSNEPIGYVSVGKGLVSDSFFFQDVERIFDFVRIGTGNTFDALAFQDVERIFDFVRIGTGNTFDALAFQDVERVFDFNRIDIGTFNVITGQETEALAIYATPPRDVTFYDSIFNDSESLLFSRVDIGTFNVITGQETEALAIYATPPRDVTFYDSIFNDSESLLFSRVDIGTINVITGQETEALAIYATPPRDVTFYDSVFRDNESLLFVRPNVGLSSDTYFFNDSESISFLNIDKTTNSSGGIFV
jgi:hypothetical protein